MDIEMLTWVFLIGGILLMILELVVPSGVALFLGFSGLTIGILRYIGFLSDPTLSVTAWLLLSVGLTIAIRPFIKKYLKPESSSKYADEDFEAMDQVVEVIKPINDKDNSGRIRFDGVSWQARSLEGNIKKGQKARIRYRENTTWIVEPMGVIDPPGNQLKQPNKN